MPKKSPTTYQIKATFTVTDEEGRTSDHAIEDVVPANSKNYAREKAVERIEAQVPRGGTWKGNIQVRPMEQVRALRDLGIGRAKQKDGQ